MDQSSRMDPRFLLTQGVQANEQATPAAKSNSDRIKQIAVSSLGFAGLVSTGILTGMEFRRGADAKILAVLLPINGLSAATFVHPLIPKNLRNLWYRGISEFSYFNLFTASNIFLNEVSQKNMAVGATGFLWWLGAFIGKDALQAASLTISEYSVSTKPPEEDQELPLLGPSPRNKKAAVIILSALATAAIAGNVLYFMYKDDLAKGELGDLQRIGIFQDLVALFGGRVFGEGIAQIIEMRKESLEKKHDYRLLPSRSLPCHLKALRMTKAIFLTVAQPLMGALYALPLMDNSPSAYACKFSSGSLQGAHRILDRREFTLLKSEASTTNIDQTEPPDTKVARCARVVKFALPKIILFGALFAFMMLIVSQNSSFIDVVMIVLAFSVTSMFMTALVGNRFRPGQNSRLMNELAFSLIYTSAGGLTDLYQYLTTKVDIYGDDLGRSSKSIHTVQLFTWAIWAIIVGNMIGNFLQKRINKAPAYTHPMTMQELSKSLVQTFNPKKT